MNRSILTALVVTIAVLAWLFSGVFSEESDHTLTDETTAETVNENDDLFSVTVRELEAVIVDDVITLQGDLEPARVITIKAETQGRIESISVQNGNRVTANQVLMTIAQDDRQARLEQAKAELKLREAELAAAEQLKNKKLISGNQLEQALANVAAAKASVKQIGVELEQTRVKAAFKGILNDRHVELGDYVSRGDPIAELIDDTSMKIVARVPQQHVSKLELGQIVQAELLDGRQVAGTLTYISNHADPSTRTFKIEAKASPSQQIRLGQSARVGLTLGQIAAHKVSSSVLNLAADGSLYINAIGDDNRVVRFEAEIIKNDSDGVWLTGLPENITVIVVGQAFVTEGQQVQTQLEGDA